MDNTTEEEGVRTAMEAAWATVERAMEELEAAGRREREAKTTLDDAIWDLMAKVEAMTRYLTREEVRVGLSGLYWSHRRLAGPMRKWFGTKLAPLPRIVRKRCPRCGREEAEEVTSWEAFHRATREAGEECPACRWAPAVRLAIPPEEDEVYHPDPYPWEDGAPPSRGEW